MRPIRLLLERHFARQPGQRNVRLGLAQRFQRGGGRLGVAGHAQGGRQHAVGAVEAGALAQRFAGEAVASS